MDGDFEMGRVLTLLYHRVNKIENDINLLAVLPEHFYEQMEWLKQNFKIVRFEDNWEQEENDAVCITFDDGYMDNFDNALPILQQLQIPATVFVATKTINTREEFWWDDLERNIYYGNADRSSIFYLEDDFFSCAWETDTLEKKEEMYKAMHWLMYDKISLEKRNDWMKQLYKWNNFDENGRSENLTCQVKECLEKDLSLVTIGAHTVTHPSLAALPKHVQREEIFASKAALEQQFRRKITTFSYPFGTKYDYNEDTMAICREAGFKKVASNYSGIWENGGDAFQIPRNIVRDWDMETFKKQISEFWDI